MSSAWKKVMDSTGMNKSEINAKCNLKDTISSLSEKESEGMKRNILTGCDLLLEFFIQIYF